MAHHRYLGDERVLQVKQKNVRRGYCLVRVIPAGGGETEWRKMRVIDYENQVRRVDKPAG